MHGVHLGHVTIFTNFRPPTSQGGFNFPLIGQVVSEKMFETNGHINVYSPRAGVDNPLGLNFFHEHRYSVNLVICCKFSQQISSFKCINTRT